MARLDHPVGAAHGSWVIVVGISVGAYSTIDGHGAHLLSPIPYIAGQFLGTSLVLGVIAVVKRSPQPLTLVTASGAGLASVLSYVLILYAYRLTEAAPVLALRQVGIAAAPYAGWFLLKEAIPKRLGDKPKLRPEGIDDTKAGWRKTVPANTETSFRRLGYRRTLPGLSQQLF